MADIKIQDAAATTHAALNNKIPVYDGTLAATVITPEQIIDLGVGNGLVAPALGADDNYVTDAEKTKLSNLSGTNTGDQDLTTLNAHLTNTSDPHDTQWDQLGGTLTKLPLNTSLATQTLAAGEMAWNPDERCFDMGINGVTLQSGQEIVVNVRNSTASTISDGTVCMAVGTVGASGRITVAPMDGTDSANSLRLLGIATEDIPAGQDGFVTSFGKVRGVNTLAYSEGDILYTSTTVAGALTNVAPTSGLKQPIAYVITDHASVGTLFVRIETLNHLAFEPANSNIQSHISSTSNPHSVTAAQAGADPVGTAAGLVSTHASSSDHDGRYYTETETNSLLSSKQNTSEKGQALGYCPLDGSVKIAETYLPDSVLGQVEYQGVWNATTNTPTIPAASSTNKGWYHIVAVSGTTTVDGIAEWTIGDWIISNGTAWTKIDNTDSVSSVFGRAGAIVSNSGDYTASQITNVPAGNIAAVTVQGAIEELDLKKEAVGVAAGLISTHNSTYDHTKLHDPVTVADSTSIDLAVTGQQISASAIFGTTSGTVCQGNDTRLSDARTPTSHTTGSHSDWPAVVSMTEVGYLDGATSAIQTQLNNKQPLDATLTALAGVTTAADKLIYATGSDTFTTATLTSAARTLLDDTTTGAMLTTLGAADDNAVVKLTGDQTVAGIKTLTSKTNLSGGALLPNAEALDLTNNNRPSIRPSLLLDFANSKTLDPRITYTRASTATYYDGKTFAKAEENLFLRSQDFDNAYWATTNTTVTANSTTAPDGTTTAETITDDGTSAVHSLSSSGLTFVANASYIFSIYVKTGTASWIQLRQDATPFAVNAFANFDVTNGVVGEVGAGATSATITSVGSGWYRCVLIATTDIGGGLYRAHINLTNNTDSGVAPVYSGSGKTVYLWGAQLEQRSTVTAYTTTTTQPITNYIPQLMTAASGVPRFDHNPTTGESLGLLIEESRTNLLTYSEDFSQSVWAKSNITIASNVIVAPNGTLTGDKLVEDTLSSTKALQYNTVGTVGATETLSVYAKQAGRSWLYLQLGTAHLAYFDLVNGVVGTTAGSGVVATIQNSGNGWFKCCVTGPRSTNQINNILLASANGTVSYTGDGYSGIYIWGAQIEAGAFPTSYIKTEASAATRAADAASMTGTNFSSWYRQDQGTLYGEAKDPYPTSATGLAASVISIEDGSNANRIQIRRSAQDGVGQSIYVANGAVQAATSTSMGTWSVNSYGKITTSFALNDIATALNGGSVVTDTSALLPVVNQLKIGNGSGINTLNGTIRKIAYYPARLSNATLQAMTTP